MLMTDDAAGEGSGSTRYSLDKARKCEKNEVQALCNDQICHGEGKAEWVRRCATSKFNHKHASEVDGSTMLDEGAEIGAQDDTAAQP